MNPFSTILVVMLLAFAANGAVNKTVNLGGDGTQYVQLNYLDNPGSDLMNIEFVAHIGKALGFYETATTICFEKQDNETDIQVGDNGFGLMFACYIN